MSEQPEGGAVAGQYLSFTLGGEDYGVDILRVREIRGWEQVRKLPDSPDYVKGVLDLRGTIVPIIDLRVRFRLENPEYTPTTVVIVMGVKDADGEVRMVGAVVDAVSDVLDIGAGQIKQGPTLGTTVNQRYLRGMVSLERGMVILLDIDRLFDANELQVIEDMVV